MELCLYLPGLFDTEDSFADQPAGGWPALEFLLARSYKSELPDARASRTLCRLFNYAPEAEIDVPVAAIGRLIDAESRPQGYWMRADPVHLQADQKSLRLLDSGSLSLTQHDALALAASVQQSFHELGWRLEVPVPTRWYVKLAKQPAIRTTEIQSVIGKDIQQYMPAGEEAVIWHRLMNEVQMQLHSADINQLRVQRGELAVNSLWMWGAGKLPDLLERRWSRVYSDENTAMGLAMLSNTPCLPLPQMADELFTEDNASARLLLVSAEFQTAMMRSGQRQQQLHAFEKNWSQPLLQKLREGSLRTLRIISRSQGFLCSKTALRRFWLNPKALADYAD